MQWIVSSSVLILVVIALRYVLRGKLSLRMQYALWLLVLVRLLVPVSFGASDLSARRLCSRGLTSRTSSASGTTRPRTPVPSAFRRRA